MISEETRKVAVAPISVGATAVYEDDPNLRAIFEFKSKQDEEVVLWEKRGDYLHVPRAVCTIGPKTKNHMTDGPPVSFTACKVVPRNDAQADFIDGISSRLAKGRSFIAEAPTGFGKTVCAVAAICNANVKTLIVVTKDDLAEQWRAAFLNFTALTPKDIGIARGDKLQYVGKRVVIGMVQSLCKIGKYPQAFIDDFGLVVFDEVHRMGAEQFVKAAGLFPARKRLGLSATPYRGDGKEFAFKAHIGEVEVRAKQAKMVPRVIMTTSTWKVPCWPGTNKLMTADFGKTMHLEKSLGQCMKRNEKICNFVKKAYDKNRHTVVFANTLQHLRLMRDGCKQLGIPAHDIALYIGGMTKTQREQATKKRVIFATMKMMSEGTDIPRLDTCVLASPRADVVQIVGRILREHPDKATPVVYDILDDDCMVFEKYAEKRIRYYKSIGCEIHVR